MPTLNRETEGKDWCILLFSFFSKKRIYDPIKHLRCKYFCENS